MDRQEKHRQKEEKDRKQRIEQDKSYENAAEKKRLPVPPFVFVIGAVLVLVAVYVWSVGMW